MFGKRKRKTANPQPPPPLAVEPHPRFVELEVRTAISVMMDPEAGSDDEVVAKLVRRGISPERSWKLLLIVPEALAHVVVEGLEVIPPSAFKLHVGESDEPSIREFAEEPYYVEARRLAQDAYYTGYSELLVPVGGRSSTWRAVDDARKMGYSASDIQPQVAFWGLEPEVWDAN